MDRYTMLVSDVNFGKSKPGKGSTFLEYFVSNFPHPQTSLVFNRRCSLPSFGTIMSLFRVLGNLMRIAFDFQRQGFKVNCRDCFCGLVLLVNWCTTFSSFRQLSGIQETRNSQDQIFNLCLLCVQNFKRSAIQNIMMK